MTDLYPLKTLGTVAGVQGGFAFKSEDFKRSGVPVLKIKNIRMRDVDTSDVDHVDHEIAKDVARYFCKSGDVLISMTGSGPQAPNSVVGRVARFSGPSETFLINQRVGRFFLKEPTKLDLRFLFFVLAQQEYQSSLVSSATGSANQANISGAQIENLTIPLPPLSEQLAIVSILAILDDKIELNRRMNETLETIARSIFKDWFVDFGPTRAKAEGRAPYLAPEIWTLFPDGLDDECKPEGWGLSTVGDTFKLTMGQSPPGATYNETGAGLPFFQGCTDFGVRYPKRRIYCTEPARVAELDDTLISVRAPVGDLNMAWERCCVGRGVAAVRHRSGYRGYTYYAMSQLQPALAAFEHTGTVFGAINKAQFEALKIIEPNPPLVDLFEEVVSDMDERIRSNETESSTIATTRNLVLPKLMSGEIRLRDAEKLVRKVS